MKTKLQSLCIGLAIIVGVHSTTAQVTNLGIAPAPGGQSLLYWPASPTNYVLQTTTNLASPNWVTASNAVMVNAATVTNSAPAGYFRLLATTNTTAGMVLIPAGSFTIGNYVFYHTPTGDPDIYDAIPTNVYVSAFYMDMNPVTWSQWQTVYAYATNHGYGFFTNTIYYGPYQAGGKAGNHPVQSVNWYDCVKWCNARSAQAGLVPVYYTDAGFTQVFTNGETDTVYQNITNNGYRLPTEAEWEKAARGGMTGTRYPWGNFISEDQANYSAEPQNYSFDLGPYSGFNTNYSTGDYPFTSPVGSFAPNGYGLYDMVGNVWEWCWDWAAGPPYPAGSPYLGGSNPTGPGPGLGARVVRGGSWDGGSYYNRCALHNGTYPGIAYNNLGFRCVMKP